MLAGSYDEHRELQAQLDPKADRDGYTALAAGAFFEAVNRRFGQAGTDADIITYVADVRARSSEAGEDLDPKLGVLTSFMVADEQWDAEGLEKFVARTRAIADHLMT